MIIEDIDMTDNEWFYKPVSEDLMMSSVQLYWLFVFALIMWGGYCWFKYSTGNWDFDTMWSVGKGTSAIFFVTFIGWQFLNKLEISPFDSEYFDISSDPMSLIMIVAAAAFLPAGIWLNRRS